jgi:hypothetical protein
MNRLRDWEDGMLSSDKGIELLRNTPATPRMPELKRRVWASLQEEQMRAPTRGWPKMRAFAVALTVALVAGTAGAVMTRRWVLPDLQRATPAAGSGSDARREHRRSTKELAPALPPAATIDPDDAVAPLDAVAPAAHQAERAAARPQAAKPRVVAETAQQERTEVLDAMIALRRDRDPHRAGMLLDRYLSRHRQGALREEALALATEAADARGDGATAERLARLYEADYPNGRFKQFARNHLSSKAANASAPPQ